MKVPYKKYVAVFTIDNVIKKMFFDDVISYEENSTEDTRLQEEYIAFFGSHDTDVHEDMSKLFIQAYLSNVRIINEFNNSVDKKSLTDDTTILIFFDMKMKNKKLNKLFVHKHASRSFENTFNCVAEMTTHALMARMVHVTNKDFFVKTFTEDANHE